MTVILTYSILFKTLFVVTFKKKKITLRIRPISIMRLNIIIFKLTYNCLFVTSQKLSATIQLFVILSDKYPDKLT